MPQAPRRWLSEQGQSLRASNVLPFHDLLDAQLVASALAAEGGRFHACISTPWVTRCVFLSQLLDPDHSGRAAVARLIVWLAINRRQPCAPETHSYCAARQRLPLGVLVRLVRQTARQLEDRTPEAWLGKGRRVTLVDGTTASRPDSKENQKAFPQAKAQGIGLGVPLVRMVAILALATRVVRDRAPGPYPGKETGETALFRTLWKGREPGAVVLGDRGVASCGPKGGTRGPRLRGPLR